MTQDIKDNTMKEKPENFCNVASRDPNSAYGHLTVCGSKLPCRFHEDTLEQLASIVDAEVVARMSGDKWNHDAFSFAHGAGILYALCETYGEEDGKKRYDDLLAVFDEVRRATLEERDLGGDVPCSDCMSKENPVWFTDNVLWNDVVRSEGYDPILCIPCFVQKVEAKYRPTGWRLIPEFRREPLLRASVSEEKP